MDDLCPIAKVPERKSSFDFARSAAFTKGRTCRGHLYTVEHWGLGFALSPGTLRGRPFCA